MTAAEKRMKGVILEAIGVLTAAIVMQEEAEGGWMGELADKLAAALKPAEGEAS